jgi:hypothetical protein
MRQDDFDDALAQAHSAGIEEGRQQALEDVVALIQTHLGEWRKGREAFISKLRALGSVKAETAKQLRERVGFRPLTAEQEQKNFEENTGSASNTTAPEAKCIHSGREDSSKAEPEEPDFIDEIVAERTARNPKFPAMVAKAKPAQPQPDVAKVSAGHGHVRPRPDGARARCGGPAICSVCARERAALKVSP